LATPGAFPSPQLAITSRGEAIGAWVKRSEDTPFDAVLQVATHEPEGNWTVKTLAPQSTASSPLVVAEPGGRARVVWVMGSSIEKQELVASTHAPGGEWTDPVSFTPEELQRPIEAALQLVVTETGEELAVWTGPATVEGGLAVRASSRSPGQPWSEPADISTSPSGRLSGDPHLRLAIAPSGEALAVWRCFDGRRWVVRAAARPAALRG
jgi:hypothetical protein